MRYLTLEVEIESGHVIAKEPDRLPKKGSGLLTILRSSENNQSCPTPLQALNALQEHLRLDAQKAAKWMEDIRDARR